MHELPDTLLPGLGPGARVPAGTLCPFEAHGPKGAASWNVHHEPVGIEPIILMIGPIATAQLHTDFRGPVFSA